MLAAGPSETIDKAMSLSNTEPVSGFTFWLYIYFLIDFFLHLSARIPGYGIIRPTLLIVLVLTALLFVQRGKFLDIYQQESFKKIKWLIVYLGLSFLLVRWPGSALNNFPDFVKAVCFFFFTAMIIDTQKRLKLFVFVFVACQVFRVYEPLYLNLTEGYWGDRTFIGDEGFAQRLAGAPSDVINPNELGFVIATVVPFLYYFLWTSGIKRKVFFLVLIPPLLYALILTMSRGALLALGVVGWMVFKRSSYKLLLIISAFGVAILAWSVMSDIQKDRYLSLVSSDTVSSATAEGRMSGMVNEMKLGLTTRPILGNGLGTTPEVKYHEWGKSRASHNLYAELLIEIGVFGMVLFLGYLKQIWFGLKRIKVLMNDCEHSYNLFWGRVSYALVAIYWMYLVYSINYFGLSQYYWYMFGGLIISVERVFVKRYREYD
ncbi:MULTISPECIES: O-antigen ligase [unclassified Oleiphilus]|uniref:O-antigen ligase family protein n=1 Tax=unclassified Oleiphilus TaxID=2631174 RepID=UPI0007C28D87|nr:MULTISPECIES: O-antigen ligase family protein [unclassified Oleiphilus]KZY69654.1 hypothetical protein A3738_15745 [Oleiphilus sp. HI0066]KZY73409.1 hypothetical protein A3739_02725 [Oleiphilus sp. HI0067]